MVSFRLITCSTCGRIKVQMSTFTRLCKENVGLVLISLPVLMEVSHPLSSPPSSPLFHVQREDYTRF